MATSKKPTSTTKRMQIPENALNFQDGDASARFTFKENSGGEGIKSRSLSMVAYSGGIIENHWWWGNLVLDISGMSFPKKSPVLREHDIERIVGFSNVKPKTDDNQLVLDDVSFMDTEDADEFIKLSDEGFPFQASVRVKPLSIERVEEGASAEVNGFTFKGPGTIFRKMKYMESSICVFGADSNTSSAAFSEGDTQLDISVEEVSSTHSFKEEKKMTLKELKDAHPELFKEIEDGVAAKFSADLAKKDEEITSLKAASESLSASKTDLETRFSGLEKEVAKNKERMIKDSASSILSTKLSASELPPRVHGKIKVDYNQFVADGELNVQKFSEAIDAEIKDWKEMFADTPSMIGGGSAPGAVPGTTETEKFNVDEAAERFARLGGIEIEVKKQ